MHHLVLLASTTIPHTSAWTPLTGIVMILCNVLAIAIGKHVIPEPANGPALPNAEFFGGMGYPALLATCSLGHVIGFGVILGLSGIGIL